MYVVLLILVKSHEFSTKRPFVCELVQRRRIKMSVLCWSNFLTRRNGLIFEWCSNADSKLALGCITLYRRLLFVRPFFANETLLGELLFGLIDWGIQPRQMLLSIKEIYLAIILWARVGDGK